MPSFSLTGRIGSSQDASPGEQLAFGIVHLIAPTVLFIAVLAGLWRHETLLYVLPLLVALIGFLLSRALGGRFGMALLTAFSGLFFNFLAVGAAAIIAALVGFYDTF